VLAFVSGEHSVTVVPKLKAPTVYLLHVSGAAHAQPRRARTRPLTRVHPIWHVQGHAVELTPPIPVKVRRSHPAKPGARMLSRGWLSRCRFGWPHTSRSETSA